LIAGLSTYAWNAIRHDPIRYLGGTILTYDVDVAHAYEDGLPPAILERTAEIVRGRVGSEVALAKVEVRGRQLLVELPRLDKESSVKVARLEQLVARLGRVDFKVVDDGAPAMAQLAETLSQEPGLGLADDEWSEKTSGKQHSDTYLTAIHFEDLRTAFQHAQTPAGHELLIGPSERGPGAARSYYVFRRAELTSADIDNVEVTFDANSGNPELAVELNAAAKVRFAALTAGNVGRKLAILLEDQVVAAPVIEGPIDGGRARITLAGASKEEKVDEARGLLAAFRLGGDLAGLPAPIRLVNRQEVSPQR
jgi:preprotein translocase subunit SecD